MKLSLYVIAESLSYIILTILSQIAMDKLHSGMEKQIVANHQAKLEDMDKLSAQKDRQWNSEMAAATQRSDKLSAQKDRQFAAATHRLEKVSAQKERLAAASQKYKIKNNVLLKSHQQQLKVRQSILPSPFLSCYLLCIIFSPHLIASHYTASHRILICF